MLNTYLGCNEYEFRHVRVNKGGRGSWDRDEYYLLSYVSCKIYIKKENEQNI